MKIVLKENKNINKVISLVFCTTIFLSCNSVKEEVQPSNIIYFLADDLGYGEVGVYGQTKINTPNIDGISFKSTLLDQAQKKHDFLYWEFPSYKGQQAVRLGKWKGIRKNIFEGNLEIELYNLENDLQEQINVANKHPEVVEKVKAIMLQEHEPSSNERFKFKALGDL